MKSRRKILAADLFCGAGGTSQGLLMAANELHADLELIAINHWNVAIDTHSINHPYAKHLCTDRFGLVEAEVMHYRLDIRFRMLQPRELARAQGFPDEYVFTGSREDVVKQIGNAVPPSTAKALAMGVLA